MDHRTIHRFLSNEEVSNQGSRRGRGVSYGITPTPELSDIRTETGINDEAGSGSRRSTRASRTRARELRMAM